MPDTDYVIHPMIIPGMLGCCWPYCYGSAAWRVHLAPAGVCWVRYYCQEHMKRFAAKHGLTIPEVA